MSRKARKPTAPRRTYSTGQVAALLGLHHLTVARLADKGELPSWKIPCTNPDSPRLGFRRFSHDALVSFARKRGLRLPDGFDTQSERATDA